MKKWKKLTAIVLCASLLAMIPAGCSKSKAESKFTVDKITMTYVKSPLNVPSMVDKSKGMFSEGFSAYGLPVAYSELTAGPDQTAALASGDIQFLFAVGDTSVILSASNGADIKIISTYSRSAKPFMLFSKDASISSPADLKGKTIAGPKGTTLNALLVAYLKTGGMTLADVNFISMDIPSSMAALEGGSVDAALLAGPAAYSCEKDGWNVVTTGEGLINSTVVVATSQKFYDENPELVKKFLEIQKSILSWTDDNHDDMIAICAKETELDAAAVEEMYPMYDFGMEITDTDIANMKKTEQFMYDNGMIENRVNIDDLILKTA